jgi:hypothetical protein
MLTFYPPKTSEMDQKLKKYGHVFMLRRDPFIQRTRPFAKKFKQTYGELSISNNWIYED